MFTTYPMGPYVHLTQALPWLLIEPQRRLLDLGNGRAYPTVHNVIARYPTRLDARRAMLDATMREENAWSRGQTKRRPRQRYIAKATLHVPSRKVGSNWNAKVAQLFNTID